MSSYKKEGGEEFSLHFSKKAEAGRGSGSWYDDRQVS